VLEGDRRTVPRPPRQGVSRTGSWRLRVDFALDGRPRPTPYSAAHRAFALQGRPPGRPSSARDGGAGPPATRPDPSGVLDGGFPVSLSESGARGGIVVPPRCWVLAHARGLLPCGAPGVGDQGGRVACLPGRAGVVRRDTVSLADM